MTASTTISDDDAEELAELREQLHPDTKRRWTFRQLSEWLRENKGVEASREAVRRAVAPVLADRAAARREVLKSKITAKLDAQLDDLDALMGAAHALVLTPSGKPKKKLDSETVLDTLDAFRKAVETKLKFSGVGERVEVDAEVKVEGDVKVTDARDELAAALAREAAGAPRPGAPGGPGAAQS